MSDLADYLVVDYLVVAGGSLAAGASVILFVGWLVSGCYRSPIARQRFAEWTLLAALLWLLVLPLLPMQPSDWLPVHYLPSARTFITQPESRRQEMPVARLHGETPADSNSVQSIDGLMQRSPITNQQASAADMSVPAPIEAALPSVQVENRGNRVTAVSGLSAGWFGFDGRDKRFLLRIYLVGTLMALGWLAFGHVALAQLVRRSRRPQSWLIQLMESLKPTTMPRILISDRCPRVITFGWWRPTIMLPTHIAHKENRSQLRHVMLHELGHIRQRDAIGQWLLNMAFVLFYGHPFYWLLRRRICFQRELVIDDWVARQTSKRMYVSDMIALAKSHRFRGSAASSLAVGAVNYPHSQFYRRIKMLVQRKRPLKLKRSRGSVVAQGILILITLALTAVWIDPPTVLGQDKQTVKLHEQIAQLQVERARLSDQIKMYQDQLAKMEAVVADLQVRLDQFASRASDQAAATAADPANRAPAQRESQSAVAEQFAAAAAAAEGRFTAETANTPAASMPSTASAHSDLIRLATSYADALTERDIAAMEIQHMRNLADDAATSKFELQVAEIRYKATQRKANMLREVADATMKSLMVELDQQQETYSYTKKLFDRGFVPKSELMKDRAALMRTESNISLLERILDNK